MIWTTLWQYKNQIGLGLIALVVLGYIATLKTEITHYKDKADTLQLEVSMEKNKVMLLQNSIDTLGADAKRKQNNSAMWKQKYESSVKRWQEVVGGLTTWTPNPNEGDCDAAKRLLRNTDR